MSASEAKIESLPSIDPADIWTKGAQNGVFGRLTPVFAAMLPESDSRRDAMKKNLQTAGYYDPHALANLSAVRYVCVMVPIILFGILLVVGPVRWEIASLVLLVTTPLLGWALPPLFVKSKATQRIDELRRSLPDMLDMLHMCVSQGLTVQGSLARISRELESVSPALSQEVRIVSEQSAVGTLRQSLDNFSNRIDLPEVRAFTSLLIQTESLGASVGEALIEHSDEMRESLRQRADAQAGKAAFKLLFPTVLCLMPAVYLFLLGPAVIELSRFFHEGGPEILDARTSAVEELNQQRRILP